ncbi:MAG: Gas vesicle protein [Pseudonocardiales bacterium]|jgi:hypothetical protein|nr:Gas vesicle protein [Pseudonocardiales bacterium]
MSEPLKPGQLQGLDGLVELLDTLIDTGVAIAGDLIISVAGVDLIQLDLRALLTGVSEPAS